MKLIATTIAFITITIAPFAFGQTAPINPFSRSLLSPEEIAALGAQQTAPFDKNNSLAAYPTPKELEANQQLSQAGNETQPSPVSMPPKTVGPADATKMSSAPTKAPSAPPKMTPSMPAKQPPVPVEKPKYVEVSVENNGSLDYYFSRGLQKEAQQSGQYAMPGSALPSTSASMNLSDPLTPIISQLRSQGVEEGKIAVELNRLTPALFARWASEVKK